MITAPLHLLHFIFPKKCVFCGQALSAGEPIDICGDCSGKIPYFNGSYLFESGKTGSGNTCNRIICALTYTDFVRKTISGYKFYDHREYGLTLAALLCERILRAEGISAVGQSFDFITCVPLSRSRLRERGYNQAAILANYAARHLGLPFFGGLLAREEHTLRQSALRRDERRANVQSAFWIDAKKTRKFLSIMQNDENKTDNILLLQGMRIILIDDIATSMATINACAATLKARGASVVVGAVLAAPQ